MPHPTEDLQGRQFGRLTVLERDTRRKGAAYWHCVCECGLEATVSSASLRSGNTRSCGCLRSETTTARSTKHGLTTRSHRHSAYGSWAAMMSRCYNKNNPRYPDWGGRGITVCTRWFEFASFAADMGEKPPGMTIERVDNDQPYEPDNCIWAPPVIQARNKRTTQLTPEAIFRIRDLAQGGQGVLQIAAATGIRRHTVGSVMATIAALS